MNNNFIDRAIELSKIGIAKGGGPFGAVIVKNNEIIAEAHNTVTIDNDPTAHAEINAIRMASRILGRFDLSDCIIYSSCEPCPMCISAIYWAKIKVVYYANTRYDAAKIGFSDEMIYNEICKQNENKQIQLIQIPNEYAQQIFNEWLEKEDRVSY
ncbi:MAG TPA: nucleoside deaminase [Candidatus Kapabacteria bacterium]|mgnify:CR=1 FL=1|nr:nucleoside deaminase [Candidatus Kapabacteria bacterium]